MKQEHKKMLLGIGMLTTIASVAVAAMILLAGMHPTEIMQSEDRKMKEVYLPRLGDADPGSVASGVLNVTLSVHVANPATYYARNLTNNASIYGWTNTNNSHVTSDLPYATAFDIIVKVRWNATHAYSSGNTTWMLSWVRANATCADLALTDTAMSEVEIGKNATYLWVNYYLNNGGAGFTISRGQNITPCQFTFDSYY